MRTDAAGVCSVCAVCVPCARRVCAVCVPCVCVRVQCVQCQCVTCVGPFFFCVEERIFYERVAMLLLYTPCDKLVANAARPTGLPTRRTGPASERMGGRFSLPSRTSEVDEAITSGSVHAEMIDELSVLTACVGPCRT